MAYRGRILVELSTLLEKTPPDKKLEPISNDDLLVVEVNVGVWTVCGMEGVLQRVGGGMVSAGLPEPAGLKGASRD